MGNKLKLIHLFAGVGSPEMALKRLGIPFEIVGYSEIDKYAIESYKAIHGDVPFLGDVTKIERLPKCNMLFWGFPCTDISVAGKQKGLLDELGNKTRSGLLVDVLRLLKIAKENNELPEISVIENVKNLVGKKFKNDFDNLLLVLDSLGYNSYWQVLNAKDYEVPQNRERVFIVSIRKDVDKRGYTFPEKMQLKKCIKDILEENPDPKLYLSDDKVARFIKNFDFNRNKKSDVVGSTNPEECTRTGSKDYVYNSENIMTCITATDYKQPKQVMIGASRGRNPENPSDRTVGAPTEQRLEINSQGISNTLTIVSKDNLVVEKIIKVDGNLYPNSGDPQAGRVYQSDGLSPSLDTCSGGNRMPKIIEYEEYSPTLRAERSGLKVDDIIRIRKLSPKECWRLMDFSDDDFDKAKAVGISNSQLYKIAGNSIVVACLYHIFRKLFIDFNEVKKDE